MVSHNEQSEELGSFVSCCSIDGIDRGESIDRPVGPGRYASSGTGRSDGHTRMDALTEVLAFFRHTTRNIHFYDENLKDKSKTII
jgi:hypothetical protein